MESRALFKVEPEPGHAFTFWAWVDPVKGKPVAMEGDLSAEGMRFAIVVARWNAVITERLLEGRTGCAVAQRRAGAAISKLCACRVRGRFRRQRGPSPISQIKGQASLDAIITLGCLLRGETAHYEAIYNEVSRGIGQSQQETGIPHSFGVLTCETLEQALNRAGIKAGNKGFEAAAAAIEMVSLRRKLAEGGARLTAGTRRKSRELAMQMLFQADMGKQTPDQVRATFWKAGDEVELGGARLCGRSFPGGSRSAGEDRRADRRRIRKHWRLERMPAVDRNLLRMAVGEMLGFKGTPFPIVINEALEIGRRYSAPESINFLNGMLDSIARSLLPK